MKTKLIIIVVTVVLLTWLGCSLGKWAQKEGKAAETRMSVAMEVLKGR